MKSTLIFFSLAVVSAFAASNLGRRQNDVPECVDGTDGPGGGFDKSS